MKLEITKQDWTEIVQHLQRQPQDLLLIDAARAIIARRRYEEAKRDNAIKITQDEDRLYGDALQYNLKGLDQCGSAARTNRLIRPLAAIDRVYFHAATLKALSVGPRTEIELLNLVAHGFAPGNVRGLDLFSSSPWIDVGNMHSMPYADNSFDVVIAGWVLVYSSDPDQACREMLRVVNHHGIIAIGATRWTEEKWRAEGKGRTQKHYPRTQDVLDMFGSAVRKVYVRHDTESDAVEGRTIVIFDVNKK